MPRTVAVCAEHLTKQYRLGAANHRMLTQDVIAWWRRRRGLQHLSEIVDESATTAPGDAPANPQAAEAQVFNALDDISFEVESGEALGIIGGNGAGKSTLLKLVARVTLPTQGRLIIAGRILSMLEIGTGMHPDLSGRDNVYLNGMLIGMSRSEVRQKFDEIVGFAEVDRFIDTPVKRYSSGMQLRLAFSVAAHFTPEILVIDEVLAVGDARFQKRCMEKMHNVLRDGRTILFVSHNLEAVGKICNKGMLLERGRSVFYGTAADTLLTYNKAINAGQFTPSSVFDLSMVNRQIGDEYVHLISAGIYSEDDTICDEFDIGQPVKLKFVFDLEEKRDVIPVPNIGVYRMDNSCAFIAAPPRMERRAAGRYCIECRVPGHLLNDGIYYIGIEMMSHDGEKAKTHFTESRLMTVRVVEKEEDPTRFRYSQKAVIPGAVRPTELFGWKFAPISK